MGSVTEVKVNFARPVAEFEYNIMEMKEGKVATIAYDKAAVMRGSLAYSQVVTRLVMGNY